MTLTYGSLFSGVGGMDMGFDTHMDCVFQVEWDKHAQSILRRHWPDVPKWGDVQEVNGADLPPCDVLTFGSPCQDLSVAGKRNGLDGERSSMFYQATRIIKEMRDATASRPTGPLPRAVVWENVPGALSSNNGHDFRAVLDTLEDIGSHLTEWAVLDAQHYGVPQRRRRIFLVAILDTAIASRCPDPLLPVSEGRRGDYAKGRKKGQEVAGSVATSVDAGSTHRQLGHGHYVKDDTASALKQRDYKDAIDLAVVPFVTNRRLGHGKYVEDDVASSVTTTNSSDQFDLAVVPFVKSRRAVAQPIIFDGTRHDDFRMDTEIVPTLKQRMGTGGGQVPMVAEPVTTSLAVRRLTPLECERLMGWPDDHTRYTDTGKEQADSNRYKQCGNGVAAPAARWIAGHLKEIL